MVVGTAIAAGCILQAGYVVAGNVRLSLIPPGVPPESWSGIPGCSDPELEYYSLALQATAWPWPWSLLWVAATICVLVLLVMRFRIRNRRLTRAAALGVLSILVIGPVGAVLWWAAPALNCGL